MIDRQITDDSEFILDSIPLDRTQSNLDRFLLPASVVLQHVLHFGAHGDDGMDGCGQDVIHHLVVEARASGPAGGVGVFRFRCLGRLSTTSRMPLPVPGMGQGINDQNVESPEQRYRAARCKADESLLNYDEAMTRSLQEAELALCQSAQWHTKAMRDREQYRSSQP